MSAESENLVLENQQLQALVLKDEWLRARVLEPEGQLTMDSKNSSKPPSGDRFKSNLTLRTPKQQETRWSKRASGLQFAPVR